MAYATTADMIAAFGEAALVELTDRAGTGSIGADVLVAALARAEAEADGYLKQRYPAGLNPVPDLVRGLVCDIARYHLYVDNMPEVVEGKHKVAIRLLESVATGRLSLGVETARPAGEVVMVARPKVFNGGLR